jgi:putative heme-binding domain-containing protein
MNQVLNRRMEGRACESGFLRLLVGIVIAVRIFATSIGAAEIPPEKLNTLIGALTRLGPEKVNANPRLKDALGQVLAATKGTRQFVEIVQTFKLNDRNTNLLELAVANPNSDAGVAAINVILANGGTELLQVALTGADAQRGARLATAIGNTLKGSTVPLLLPLLKIGYDTALQKEAVRSLAKFKQGAEALLKLAASDAIPDTVRLTATMELNSVRWIDLKERAAKLLPLPQTQSGEAFPTIAELVGKSGNATRGKKIYARETVACNRCHQVNGDGIDFGPALSEIGSKLTKEALYESILAPSSGILMGYESWSIETTAGDEYYGLLISDTKDELAIKTVGGIVNRIKKSDIGFQRKSQLSTMPTGLQQLMTVQDMVDLVEYLSSLKKK